MYMSSMLPNISMQMIIYLQEVCMHILVSCQVVFNVYKFVELQDNLVHMPVLMTNSVGAHAYSTIQNRSTYIYILLY